MKIYLLSCADIRDGGGVYAYELEDNGALEKTGYLPCDRPMYAVKCDKGLCVLLRQPIKSSKNSAYFFVDEDLKNPSETVSTKGVVACHLAVDEKDVFVVNYLSGSVCKNGLLVETRQGSGPNESRQDMPHTHYVGFMPDGLLAVTDLGTDSLAFYNRELNFVSQAKVPDGYGIRHIALSKNGRYVYAINELIPSISMFEYENGMAKLLKTEKITCTCPKASGAAIRIVDDSLLVSVREENAIYIYEINGSSLAFKQKIFCGGDGPRDFDVCNGYVVCTNEKSDSVTVLKLKDGAASVVSTTEMRAPLCVVR